MDTIIIYTILIFMFLIILRNHRENFELNFPEDNNLKCKCDMDEVSNKEVKNKVIETYSNYDNSEPEIAKRSEDRNYIIYNNPNEQTAEEFYLNKIQKYPFIPLEFDNKVVGYNIIDYENIGLNTDRIMPENKNNIESHKFNYGIMYEN